MVLFIEFSVKLIILRVNFVEDEVPTPPPIRRKKREGARG
jgi:hypothetical protein